MWPHGLKHARLPCPSPSPGVCPGSCPLSWTCYLAISSSDPSSSSAFNVSQHQSFPKSKLFASGGQNIGASASASVFPENIQGWFPLRLTSLILQSKGFLTVFSNTTVQKHQFFRAQPSLFRTNLFDKYKLYACLRSVWKILRSFKALLQSNSI